MTTYEAIAAILYTKIPWIAYFPPQIPDAVDVPKNLEAPNGDDSLTVDIIAYPCLKCVENMCDECGDPLGFSNSLARNIDLANATLLPRPLLTSKQKTLAECMAKDLPPLPTEDGSCSILVDRVIEMPTSSSSNVETPTKYIVLHSDKDKERRLPTSSKATKDYRGVHHIAITWDRPSEILFSALRDGTIKQHQAGKSRPKVNPAIYPDDDRNHGAVRETRTKSGRTRGHPGPVERINATSQCQQPRCRAWVYGEIRKCGRCGMLLCEDCAKKKGCPRKFDGSKRRRNPTGGKLWWRGWWKWLSESESESDSASGKESPVST